MTNKGFSYLRFSTPEQLKGDSYRRQTDLAREYARRHGLELDQSLTFEDLGVSAYRSRNAKTGALRAFLDAVDAGVIPKGSYLLVESLDRVSRDDILSAQGLFMEIINSGVTLVTLVDNRAYSKASVNAAPMDLIMSLLTMFRANEESQTKARRLAAAWHGKRLQASAEGKPLTKLCPGWLRLSDDRSRYEVIPERATVVQRIFQLTLEGVGKHSVARMLNEEGVPVFGSAQHWGRAYVVKILKNPATIGTLVPRKSTHDPETGKRTRPALDPVPDYFPRVIDQETYEAVQALMAAQYAKVGPTGLQNILAGLARCPLCGSSMVMVAKGLRSRRKLVCSRSRAGAGCQYRSVDLEAVESAVLGQGYWLLEDRPSDTVQEESIRDQLRNIDAPIGNTVDAIQNLLEAIEKGKGSTALLERLSGLEADLVALRGNERDLQVQLESVARSMLDRKVEILEDALSGDFNREKINAALRGLFGAVVVDYGDGELKFQWIAGGESWLQYEWPDRT